MLEWYRVEEPYGAVMDDCVDFLRRAAEAAGADRVTFREVECDPFADAERLTVAEAFRGFAGIDLLATLSGRDTDRDGLVAAATAAGIRTAPDDTWSDVFSRVLVERIEPRLGFGRPTHPDGVSRPQRRHWRDRRRIRRTGSPSVSSCSSAGVELANGFGELTDAIRAAPALHRPPWTMKQRLYGETLSARRGVSRGA